MRRAAALAPLLALVIPAHLAAQMPSAAAPSLAVPLDPDDPPASVRSGSPADDRMTIPIRIGRQGPWHFVVDTGSQRTVVSRALADRLGLANAASVTIISMTGRTQVASVALPPLAFGATTVHDIQAPVLDGDHLGAPGLLGLDGLRAKRLLLDFRRGMIEISASGRRQPRDPDAIIVEARRRDGQLILLDSQVEGSSVSVILDTGTNISVGNLALYDRLAKRRRAPAVTHATLTSVTGGMLTGLVGVIGTMRMGAVTLKDLPVLFADASPFAELGLDRKPALLLGINALRGFDRVAIDFGRGKVDFLLPDQGALIAPQLAALGAPAQP